MYFNVFRHIKRADVDLQGYAADAAHMEALVSEQPGFLGYKRFTSADGESLSISEWASQEAARS